MNDRQGGRARLRTPGRPLATMLAVAALLGLACGSGGRATGDGGGSGGTDGARDGAADGPAAPAFDGRGNVPPGGICSVSLDCATGTCIDGRCCLGPCLGPCQRCNESGVCQPVPAGTACGPGMCLDENHLIGGSACDGRGACGGVALLHCGPYLCRNGNCTSSCQVDGDCESPSRCLQNSCRGDSPMCTRNEQCASGFCAQGMCCDRACDGVCASCALPASRGRCTPLPAASRPDAGCSTPDGGLD